MAYIPTFHVYDRSKCVLSPNDSLNMSAKKPQTRWAQRKDRIFLTLDVFAPKNVQVEFSPSAVLIKGTGSLASGAPESDFQHEMKFLHTIDHAACTYKVVGNSVQIFIMKKEKAPYWERLLVEPSKVTKQWLSCDWAYWVDEEEEDALGAKKDPTNFGGYGDLSHMNNTADSDDESEDDEGKPPADISDLDR